MWLCTEGRLKSTSVSFGPGRVPLIIEAGTELIAWSSRLQLPVIHARAWTILNLLDESSWARARLLVGVWLELFWESKVRQNDSFQQYRCNLLMI